MREFWTAFLHIFLCTFFEFSGLAEGWQCAIVTMLMSHLSFHLLRFCTCYSFVQLLSLHHLFDNELKNYFFDSLAYSIQMCFFLEQSVTLRNTLSSINPEHLSLSIEQIVHEPHWRHCGSTKLERHHEVLKYIFLTTLKPKGSDSKV